MQSNSPQIDVALRLAFFLASFLFSLSNANSQSCTPGSCEENCSPGATCEAGGDPRDTCRWGGNGCPYSNQTVIAGCCCNATPILLDIDGSGFQLTSAAHGITFDIGGDGRPDRVSWTAERSTNAWLVFDRNGNGRIDDGTELFGNATPQPIPAGGAKKNGFLALAAFDTRQHGGNSDGIIDRSDAVFADLRLWQDMNHDGVSQRRELHTLESLGIVSIQLAYKSSRRTDEHGNTFRYRAKVDMERHLQGGPWAWDVILVVDNSLLEHGNELPLSSLGRSEPARASSLPHVPGIAPGATRDPIQRQ